MSSKEMAVLIADKLRNLAGLDVYITAEEILAKCDSWDEVAWWYRMLNKET